MIDIQLKNKDWINYQAKDMNIWIKGTIYIGNKKIEDNELIQEITKIENFEDMESFASILNGFFTLIIQKIFKTYVVMDSIRSFPVFYSKQLNYIKIFDEPEKVLTGRKEDINLIALEEFKLLGYVTGSETLLQKVKQIQASEIVEFSINSNNQYLKKKKKYFFLNHLEPKSPNINELSKLHKKAIINSLKRLIDFSKGRQLVIPLSGGYDSRFIASMLKKLNYQNLLAFSYGKKDNKESNFSESIAKKLNIPWIFIEYTEDEWENLWDSDLRLNYSLMAGLLTSTPHIQDWLAVKKLVDLGVLNSDCIFVPGHSADFLAGSHIPIELKPNKKYSIDSVSNYIFKTHYNLSSISNKSKRRKDFWKSRIQKRIEKFSIVNDCDFADSYERWNMQERQSKFTCNSVRVYEYFGYKWWLPFWDKEYIEFWERVPLSLRKGKSWYNLQVQNLTETNLIELSKLKNASENNILRSKIVKVFIKLNILIFIKKLRFFILNKKRSNFHPPWVSWYEKRLNREEILKATCNGIEAKLYLIDLKIESE